MRDTTTATADQKPAGAKAVQPVSNKRLDQGMNKAVSPSYNKGISNAR